ncbi:hypothetical protein MPSEU_000162700 [Mayamaea pseudoterrestris]|nr:hypothetical protein MPSEU_000162700 [Mayamaea pseudoterrestris]
MATTTSNNAAAVRLLHHGAAANSTNQAVLWLPGNNANEESRIVYASHNNLSMAQPVTLANEQVWSVRQTLRSSVSGTSITCIGHVRATGIACGHANGAISLWWKATNDWKEHLLHAEQLQCKRSVTVITVSQVADDGLLIVVGSSSGANLLKCKYRHDSDTWSVSDSFALLHTPVSSVELMTLDHDDDATDACQQVLILVGTASHRNNKIHVWQCNQETLVNDKDANDEAIGSTIQSPPTYAGALQGHEDWVSCLAFKTLESSLSSTSSSSSWMLASGSQDQRIRLWKFVTRAKVRDEYDGTKIKQQQQQQQQQPSLQDAAAANTNDDDFDANDNVEQENEGESRLEILGAKCVTSVFLEALLVGHEASVTSVVWHPNPHAIYKQSDLLVSSSMDRSILLWAPMSEHGIWAPLARVGSAGGILGGPVGSSLLGFCKVVVEPVQGQCLVGHAYGGALHVWSVNDSGSSDRESPLAVSATPEDRASMVSWIATPCITGHFAGVTDLCWEASSGQYLLTVSNDQTCRLWAPVGDEGGSDNADENVWLELGRPMVHGYDLSAITSVSTPRHPHRIVSGADEKEIRVFDAPLATLRLLKSASKAEAVVANDPLDRVERAYIPSLGLTNKATAADGAEVDIDDEDATLSTPSKVKSRIPLERDLGSESIWPEVQKLFGHNSELYCLTSTCEAQFGVRSDDTSTSADTLVASSTKARDADSAAIRLWNMTTSKCIQVLTEGHKATVATMSFSRNGQYLVSSGKDRRICLWRRDDNSSVQYSLAWAKDSAHKRIIWSAHFCPFDETIFASGSRDGCIKLWKISNDDSTLNVLPLCSFAPHHHVDGKPDAVTAISFAPHPLGNDIASMILAVGLESGLMELWKLSLDKEGTTATPQIRCVFPPSYCHSARVSKLAWRPCSCSDSSKHVLASCSMDHGCRIFSIELTK